MEAPSPQPWKGEEQSHQKEVGKDREAHNKEPVKQQSLPGRTVRERTALVADKLKSGGRADNYSHCVCVSLSKNNNNKKRGASLKNTAEEEQKDIFEEENRGAVTGLCLCLSSHFSTTARADIICTWGIIPANPNPCLTTNLRQCLSAPPPPPPLHDLQESGAQQVTPSGDKCHLHHLLLFINYSAYVCFDLFFFSLPVSPGLAECVRTTQTLIGKCLSQWARPCVCLRVCLRDKAPEKYCRQPRMTRMHLKMPTYVQTHGGNLN